MDNGFAGLSLADFTRSNSIARDTFCKELIRRLTADGFVVLRDHPVSGALLDQAYEHCAAVFAQADEIKCRHAGGLRGYAAFGTEHAKDRSSPDLKEFWQIGPELEDGLGYPAERTASPPAPRNIWPESPSGFKATFLKLFAALQRTARIILEALTPGLGLRSGFFEPLVRERNSVLRLLHYPPIPSGLDADSARSAAHEDINLVTLLAAPRGAGLEFLDHAGEWRAVTTDRHDLLVNSGDMLARLTNDVISAATHRVVNPTAANVSRYSMPFFVHPNSDVMLSCLPSCVGEGAKYPDIRAGDFLEQRLRDIGLVRPAPLEGR